MVVLNASASLIFTLFETPRLIGDAIAQLALETGAPATAISPDVLSTIDALIDHGMLADSETVHTRTTDAAAVERG